VKPIPIYDDTVPVACTASSEELPVRLEVIERLHSARTGVERTEHGLRLRFPDRPDTAAELGAFVVDEKACCQFWGFALSTDDGELVLQWDGPPAIDELMDRLHAYFTGDDSTVPAGLL
jgi:hypothetical protein